MSMAGRSKVPPPGEATPLGTPRTKKTKAVKTPVKSAEKISVEVEKTVAQKTAVVVNSDQHTGTVAQPLEQEQEQEKKMENETVATPTLTLTRKPATPKALSIQYGIDGRRGSVRFSKSLFATAPDTITIPVIDGMAEVKRKETKEERKARLQAMPKKTAAEKLAALEKKAERLRAKLAESQQTELQPA